MTEELKSRFCKEESQDNVSHHEMTSSFQKKIKTVVAALVSMIAEMENPFIDDTKDLFSLDTKVVMDASAVELVNRMLLAASIKKFIEESLKETSAAVLSHTIFKNGFATFKTMFRESSQKG